MALSIESEVLTEILRPTVNPKWYLQLGDYLSLNFPFLYMYFSKVLGCVALVL